MAILAGVIVQGCPHGAAQWHPVPAIGDGCFGFVLMTWGTMIVCRQPGESGS